MNKLDSSPQILAMATALKVGGENAVNNIVRFCRGLVSKWCQEEGGVDNIQKVERIVCSRLRLVIEEFHSTEELKAIVEKYVALGERIFKILVNDFDENTFATLMERRNVTALSPDRYVAVVDCRGEKAFRRFFSRWHEIAHLLTLHEQLELPFHRTTTNQDPLERLMDIVAGAVGFLDPLFVPLVERELALSGYLTFAGVERIRSEFCPEASFQATFNACTSRVTLPVVVIDAGWGWKKSEQEDLGNDFLKKLGISAPVAKIRALSVRPNDIARRTIRVHQNMEIPSSSVISRLLRQEGEFEFVTEAHDYENLRTWKHSNGSDLGDIEVRVEARRIGDGVIALLQPQIIASTHRTPGKPLTGIWRNGVIVNSV